ncbi:hypothetical protein NSTC731_06425 [Nostoc sp. DSM 114167]
MSNLTFDKSLALSLYQSDEQFPVNLDDAWQWLGYGKKRTAKDTLKSNFIEGEDFSRRGIKSSGGRPSEVLLLSIECFKMLGMLAGTEQGKAIRKYFIECERIAKANSIKPQQAYLIVSSKLAEWRASESLLTQEMEKLEDELFSKKRELQDVRQNQLMEAKAFNDTHPGVLEQALIIKEIIDRAKQANKYLNA